MEQLLERRAPPVVSSDGWSPLALAVDQGHGGVLDRLLGMPEEEGEPKPAAGRVLERGLEKGIEDAKNK